MKLSILVPVYNEENTIGKVLANLIRIQLPVDYEIIVVDDGSTDKSLIEIKKFKSAHIRIKSKVKNSGKGAAIKTGLKLARGDYILIQDADMEYSPSEIKNLLKPLLNKSRKLHGNLAVYGSRFLNNQAAIPAVYFWGNRFLTLLMNLIYQVKLNDMETGYKIIPADFLRFIRLKSEHFDFEPEITAKLIKNGINIIEVPVSYRGRSRTAGKKLTLRDAFGAIKAIFYYRFFN